MGAVSTVSMPAHGWHALGWACLCVATRNQWLSSTEENWHSRIARRTNSWSGIPIKIAMRHSWSRWRAHQMALFV